MNRNAATPLRFTKLHGCGNDYLYLDCISHAPPHDPHALARAMSDRHFGVGGDGLILLLPPTVPGAHARMRMFNADGSEGRMCGNGIRGLAKFAHDRGLTVANPLRVETLRGVLELRLDLDSAGRVSSATVDMDEPILEADRIPIALPSAAPEGRAVGLPLFGEHGLLRPEAWNSLARLDPDFTCVSMGSAHVLMFCGNLREVPLETVGPKLERHPMFPERVNVHFASVAQPDVLQMRSWERGSGITLACGTGACAVVVAAVLTRRGHRRAQVHLPGGELSIHWREQDNHVLMSGGVAEVFSGEWPASV